LAGLLNRASLILLHNWQAAYPSANATESAMSILRFYFIQKVTDEFAAEPVISATKNYDEENQKKTTFLKLPLIHSLVHSANGATTK